MSDATKQLRRAVEYGLAKGKRNVIADLAPLDELFNSHDELVAACRAALEEDAAPENPGGILTEATRDQLRAALARAGQAVPS